MSDKIITSVDGAIGRIVFNQPEKRNAVSLEMWTAVDEALDHYAADDNVRVVILSGAGGKAFVSGADISKFESERASEEAVAHYNTTTARVYTKVHAFPKPVIAQIDGFCVGGGCALAVCCDIRVCGEGAQFAVPAAKLGLGYAYAGLERLVALVGPSFAKEIFFTADRFSAEDAKFMGLVNRVVPDGEVEAFCTAMANRIAGNAPLTVGSVKFIVGEAVKPESERDLQKCADLVKGCFDSQDYIEGRRAFMEKRKPNFVGA
ncbi:MAG: enoyl-CoA hydratase [Thalassobaculum sp.]|uniref:enoyl-CoA hydratase n=1 Tax=Thalassobaculum sp. TaxID=2022740 RepID=UPI0032EB5682